MSNMMKNVATKMLCVYLFIMHSSTGSLTSWYFYAQTSCLSDAGTDSSSTYVTLMYEANGSPSNIKEDKQYLYDLSGNDNEQCKGSMWKFEAPEDFISPHNYKSLSISTDSSDGWNIEMDFAITADNTTGKLFLLAYDGEIYQWLDTDNGRREASLGRDRLACKVANQCITQFIIVGYTGDVSDAGSDDSFAFKLEKYGVGIETHYMSVMGMTLNQTMVMFGTLARILLDIVGVSNLKASQKHLLWQQVVMGGTFPMLLL